jgi:ubiquinone/menaquinone biosynthesis C-methylase UbiE
MPKPDSHYDDAVEGWATGAELVYAPLARELVATSPHSLDGRRVLDVGAGTGVGSTALVDVGARPVALDLSWPMLSWRRHERPPSVVASVTEVPVRDRAVDDIFASFVLNHVAEPEVVLRGLARTVRPGGAVLASTFSNEASSPARDRADAVAVAHGWQIPEWYTAMKTSIVPLLGSSEAMQRAATAAGLEGAVVIERPVDVGVDRAEDLVAYRFGQAQFADFVGSLGSEGAAALRSAAVEAVEPIMEPYRPTVVFLAAVVA